MSSFNRALVAQTRKTKDSAKKAAYRNKSDSLPRLKTRDLTNGQYRIRLWPAHEKNPHGYLDYRVHSIPQDYPNIEGIDPGLVTVQCPRSSNWDPIPLPGTDDEYQNRCICCELDQVAFDEDEHGNVLMDILPEGLQSVIQCMDYQGNWQSGIYLPISVCARIHTSTQETSAFGKVYTKHTYMPGGPTDIMGAQLQLRHPDFRMRQNEQTGLMERVRNGLPEMLFDLLELIPDIGDMTLGRWITLTKVNDGKGAGGYSLVADPHTSPFDASFVDYKKIYAFPKWGDKTQKKASIRLPLAQQEAIVVNSRWAQDWRAEGLPLTDADAEALERGEELVRPPAHQPAMYQPTAPVPQVYLPQPVQQYPSFPFQA